MNWGVPAYNEWKDDRLLKFNYDVGNYFVDLHDLKNLTIENFVHAMCRFIPEVTKKKVMGLIQDIPYIKCAPQYRSI